MPQGLEDSYFLLFICFCCVEFVSLYFLLFGSTFMAFSSTYCSCFFCFCLILLYAFVLNDGCFHRLSEQSFYPLLQLFFFPSTALRPPNFFNSLSAPSLQWPNHVSFSSSNSFIPFALSLSTNNLFLCIPFMADNMYTKCSSFLLSLFSVHYLMLT